MASHDQSDDEQDPVAGAVGQPPQIHPTAVVEDGARIAADVIIGASCVISSAATIGRGTVLANHVTISGRVVIGERNRIFPNCVIGGEPQDLTYRGTDTRVEVGVEPAREILRSQGMLVPQVNELLEFLERQQQGRHGRARERRKAA